MHFPKRYSCILFLNGNSFARLFDNDNNTDNNTINVSSVFIDFIFLDGAQSIVFYVNATFGLNIIHISHS